MAGEWNHTSGQWNGDANDKGDKPFTMFYHRTHCQKGHTKVVLLPITKSINYWCKLFYVVLHYQQRVDNIFLSQAKVEKATFEEAKKKREEEVRNEKTRRYLTSMRKKQSVSFAQKFPNADPLALRLLEKLLAFDPKKSTYCGRGIQLERFYEGWKEEREKTIQQPAILAKIVVDTTGAGDTLLLLLS
ncbi:hypothetical protein JHK82_043499 [Glycine max]|nr:hypothetical protein JHK86_043385 [Glycine max]KAG5106529.1 hypothetical protein JHK82_043499 [Glycine max]KAG5117456.1 hypothetical protein JHK84_043569 [Glycine max]